MNYNHELKQLKYLLHSSEVDLITAREEKDRLKAAIKKHHDAKGHDRCWLNDYDLYIAAGIIPENPQLPCREEFLSHCGQYYDQQCHKDKDL